MTKEEIIEGKIIEDKQPEVTEKKITVKACYKYFWATDEFELWQKRTRESVINIAQITPVCNGTDSGVCVIYTEEEK